jgi:CIC family chloride channel protein
MDPLFKRQFDLKGLWKWLWLGALVGGFVGLFALLFQFLLQTVNHFCFNVLIGIPVHHPDNEKPLVDFVVRQPAFPYLIVVMTGLGGLVTALLVQRFAPEAQGHGTDNAINAYHRQQGLIRPRVPIVKLIASVITIGTGGSGGREGPVAQIGAGIGSFIATRLKLGPRTRRMLVAAGIAAGIGSIFRAPLAAAIFAAEVLYSGIDIEAEVLLPAMVASIIGYSVFSAVHGFEPIFGLRGHFSFSSPIELIPYLILAMIVGIGALMYVNVFNGLTDTFARMRVNRYLKPAIGGVLTGAIGLALLKLTGKQESLAVLSTGYGVIQSILTTDGASLGVGLLLLISLGKILTTSLTIGSGGSAGVFGPSMVIGGTLGAAVGQVMHSLWPSAVPHPATFTIVGMAGFFSAAANTPLSTLVMVGELTGNYELLIPSMWVCALAFLVGRRWTLYRSQVPSKIDSPAHFGEFAGEILAGTPVAEVYKATRKHIVIPAGMKIGVVFDKASQTSQRIFPVADGEGNVTGFFRLGDLTHALHQPPEIVRRMTAGDLAVSSSRMVRLKDPVRKALDAMTYQQSDELLVTEDDNPARVVGIITGADIMLYYSRRLSQIKEEAREKAEEDDGFIDRPSSG